jgi:S1-C subfamily serine protease
MAATAPARPRVSRETRLLLGVVLVSLVALWVLARLRFPERAATSNPVPPLLTQLAPRSTFDDLAFAVSQLTPRISTWLTVLEVTEPVAGSASHGLQAMRIRPDLAVTMMRPDDGAKAAAAAPGLDVVASDPASGFAVIRVQSEPLLPPDIWSPRTPQQPRYLIAVDVSRDGPSLRPAFVGALRPVVSPTWSGTILAAPASADLASGTFVFSTEGAWAGLVTDHGGRPAIVPADVVIVMAERLLSEERRAPGWLGVAVQPLTPALRSATGADAGVIVTWVDARGPAFGRVEVTDVIEAVNGEGIATDEHWRARAARFRAGETLALRIRRKRGVAEVRLSAVPRAAAEATEIPLGLTMRAAERVGAEVLRVLPESAAARAGIQAGDLLTVVGELRAPTPAQTFRAFAATPKGTPLLVAVTRGGTHHVLTLQK